jgi:cell division protein FtsW (lipid II flippase)
LALEQWWAWCLSAILLPLAALAAPWVLNWVHFLSHALWGRRTFFGVGLRWLVGGLVVSVFYLAHRQNIPQYVTGELLKMVFIVCLCGWCVWKMPLAAQLWHAGHTRTSVRYLLGAMSLMLLAFASAFVTSDKGPLLVMALLLAVLLATVLGWTGGMGLLILGFAVIFLVGVDLDVVGERLQAWRNPFTADRDDMARLMWFQLEAARYEWGFGVGQVPWCGTARLDVCHGLPLQLQSDYTFTAIMGWWGPWGAWAWLLLFSAYVYRALVYCARVSPAVLTPLTLLEPKIVKEVTAIHLLFLFAVLVLMQTWITVAGNLGWLPLTGVTWPLMSYGKSSLWITTLFVGAWGLRRPNA